MNDKLLPKLVTTLGLCAGVICAPALQAALIAYEGFSYDAGSALAGQTGGTGFTDAWGASGGATTGVGTIQAPGWNYASLNTAGNKLYAAGSASGNFAMFRTLAAPQGADGTTVWISFMAQSIGALASTNGPGGSPSRIRPVNFSLYDGTSERLALGEGTRNTAISRPDTDVWGLVERGGVDNAGTRWTTAPLDQQSLAVVRIDFGAGNLDTAYMWINPSLDVEPLIADAMATTTFSNMAFSRVRPFAGNPTAATGNVPAEAYFDEIRIGTTFGDVAPIPEPTAAAIVALGTACLVLRRRLHGRR